MDEDVVEMIHHIGMAEDGVDLQLTQLADPNFTIARSAASLQFSIRKGQRRKER